MTQFVPVWSGVALHSRRLARAQLWLIGGGVVIFVAALLTTRLAALPVGGGLMLTGFWTLAFVVALTTLGVALAVGFVTPAFGAAVARPAVVAAHATLAVFGALYQLVPMFGRTDLDALDRRLRRVETAAYPAGVVVLAGRRLFALAAIARIGALLLLAVAVVLSRRLRDARAERTPMLARYALLAPTLLCWALVTLPAWLRAPLAPAARFDAPGTGPLLAFVLVLVGTLYHVVPFLVWLHRYADRLGVEAVPMIDDRLETADLAFVAGGGALLVGGGSLAVGLTVFAANLSLVVWRHALRRESTPTAGTD